MQSLGSTFPVSAQHWEELEYVLLCPGCPVVLLSGVKGWGDRHKPSSLQGPTCRAQAGAHQTPAEQGTQEWMNEGAGEQASRHWLRGCGLALGFGK